MAIYHCRIKMIGRSSGRSAVAAAAYRSGECLTSNYDGATHDYRKKNWVEYTNILLPKNAPEEYKDRSILWNEVEKVEKTSDAQLAREFELALPVELSHKEHIQMVNQFVLENLVEQGMCADIAIHNPPYTNDRHQPVDASGYVTDDVSKMRFINPHAHILVTVRPIDDKGKWTNKTQKEYICKRGNVEKAFTSNEFKDAKLQGWEKQYRYIEDGKKVWYSKSELGDKELKRANNEPKTTPYGRLNEIIAHWSHKDRVFEWRQHWERIVNDKLASNNLEERVDCRSFKDQGREDELPTMHMGVSATNMEKRADREIIEGKKAIDVIRSDIGDINREIKAHNAVIFDLKKKLENIIEKTKEAVKRVLMSLEAIRFKMIGNKYQEKVLGEKQETLTYVIAAQQNTIKTIDDLLNKKTKLQNELTIYLARNRDLSVMHVKKRHENKIQIQLSQEKLRNVDEYISITLKKNGYESEKDYNNAKKTYEIDLKNKESLDITIDELKDKNIELATEYRHMLQAIEGGEVIKASEIKKIRIEMEKELKLILKDKHQNGYNERVYSDSKKYTDKILGIKNNDDRDAKTQIKENVKVR